MKIIPSAITHSILLASFLLMVISCSKSNNNSNSNNNNSTSPPPLPANDNKSGGVYKGTITGSTGSFYINLQNGDNKMYAQFDGVLDTLSTSTIITSGTAINQAVFTGHTGMVLTFSVNADGSNPVVNSFVIPGHPFAEAFLFKETTSQSVMVFEGRFTTGGGASCQSGLLNIILVGSSSVFGYYKEDGGQHLAGSVSTSRTGSSFTFTAASATVNCTVNNNYSLITGTSSDPSGCTSVISCNRKY